MNFEMKNALKYRPSKTSFEQNYIRPGLFFAFMIKYGRSEIALGQKYELASVSNLLNYWMLFKVILDHF